MSARTFVATHCGQVFSGEEGALNLAAHMRREHGIKPYKPGSKAAPWEPHGAPGWRNGEIEKPTPWAPPRRTKPIEQVVADWRDEVEHVYTDERQEVAA